MQACLITEPGRTALEERRQPTPGSGELLLQTRLIGLCGTDLSTFRGKNPLVSYPRIPGHEIAATVVEAGPDVPPEWQTGLNVTVYPNTHCGACASCKNGRTNACRFNQTLGVQRDGAMQEYFTAPWQKVFRADALSLRELTLVEPIAVGFHAVERGRVTLGDTVAVLGCGMVGLGALTGAIQKGASTIAIDLDEAKLALAQRVGARFAINAGQDNWHEQLLAHTAGLGPDVIIEAVGTPETYRMALEAAGYSGRVVFVGWVKEPAALDTKLFVHKELDILGSRNSLGEFPAVIDMLSQHRFPVEESISKTVSLPAVGSALEQWAAMPSRFTKILVEVTN